MQHSMGFLGRRGTQVSTAAPPRMGDLSEDVRDHGGDGHRRHDHERRQQSCRCHVVRLLDGPDGVPTDDDEVDDPAHHVEHDDTDDRRGKERPEAVAPVDEVAGDTDADHDRAAEDDSGHLERRGEVALTQAPTHVVLRQQLVQPVDGDHESHTGEVEHDGACERQPVARSSSGQRTLDDEADAEVEPGLDHRHREVALPDELGVIDLPQDREVHDEPRDEDCHEDPQPLEEEPERRPERLVDIEVGQYRQHGDDLRGHDCDALDEVGVVLLVEDLGVVIERSDAVHDDPLEPHEEQHHHEPRDGEKGRMGPVCEHGHVPSGCRTVELVAQLLRSGVFDYP